MATQIRTFGMSQMSIGSCSDFHSKVLGFIATATPAALHIEAKTDDYTAAVETLASIVNRQRSFIATASLKDTDKIRDNASGVICSVTDAYLTSPVEEKSAAAHLLHPQLSPYRGIRYHEYTKQTAEVKGMLATLDQLANKAAVTTLGLTAEVDALRAANVSFEKAFLDKTKEMSDRMTQSDVKTAETVAKANTLYGEIIQIVNAYAIVQLTDAITTFIANINGLVGVYSRIAGSSGSGSSTAPGGDDKPIIPPSGGDDDRPVIE
ncbi:DUF6261 family protein [Parabacteroides sp.]